tara:strand:+ start:25 stop:699 length:675 start_codon:yes stop_codon:yes gene_type:complete
MKLSTAKSSEISLVLASSSPRRKDILSLLGYQFKVVVPTDKEDKFNNNVPIEAMTRAIALGKTRHIAKSYPNSIIIAADTVVYIDGIVFGKPASKIQAKSMLTKLRGRTHQVVTGLAVINPNIEQPILSNESTKVTMRHYSDHEIFTYLSSSQSLDKAGAYGIQDKNFSPSKEIKGCYLNVVGLPLCNLIDIFSSFATDLSNKFSNIYTDNCVFCKSFHREDWS